MLTPTYPVSTETPARPARRLRKVLSTEEFGLMMERTQIFGLMSELKLYGMRNAYDEVMSFGIKWQHEPPQIVGDLFQTEIAAKQARSIKYQMTIAKLPLEKDIDDFDFDGATVNESWCAISPALASSRSNAMSFSSAAADLIHAAHLAMSLEYKGLLIEIFR